MATYIMSDIHGLSQYFYGMIDQLAINENDSVYVLGDVIDRGSDGIAIINYIMSHDNYHMLMGNHEHLMISYLNHYYFGTPPVLYRDNLERLWDANGGKVTRKSFFNLPQVNQDLMYDYLLHLPYQLSIECNGYTYCLVHALPKDSQATQFSELTVDDVSTLFWGRPGALEGIKYFIKEDQHVIAGHTPTIHYIPTQQILFYPNDKILDASYIDIDCGCSLGYDYGVLSCLRLDDMQCFYQYKKGRDLSKSLFVM